MKEKLQSILPVIIVTLTLTFSLWCTIYDSATSKTVSEDTIETTEVEWYPWKLTADWTQQEIPVVEGTSHEKFKQLCQLYWLDASLIRSLENKYNLLLEDNNYN